MASVDRRRRVALRPAPGRRPTLDAGTVRRLARLRAEIPALQAGEQRLLDTGPDILAWTREDARDRLLAAVNFTAKHVELPLPSTDAASAILVLSTDPDRPMRDLDGPAITLGPSEAVLVRM
jgi:hypothetical protein